MLLRSRIERYMATKEFQSFCTELYIILSSETQVDGIRFGTDFCIITKGSREFRFTPEDARGETIDSFLEVAIAKLG